MTLLADPASAVPPILRMMLVAPGILSCIPPASAADAARLLAQGCLACHGPGGSGSGAIPAIAGMPPATLRDLMRAFRSDERAGTIMNRIARGYTEPEIAALADHFARGN